MISEYVGLAGGATLDISNVQGTARVHLAQLSGKQLINMKPLSPLSQLVHACLRSSALQFLCHVAIAAAAAQLHYLLWEKVI